MVSLLAWMAVSVGFSSVSVFDSFMLFLFVFSLLPSQYGAEVYNITSLQPLAQGQTLVSPSHVFELGFFSPNSSANKYVGLWHKSIFPRKIIWVANRENPLAVTDSLATLRIGSNGNLELVDGKQSSVWSTNVSVSTNGSAVLLDSGAFVLRDDMGAKLWQSFDDPSGSLLPDMLLGFDSNTGKWNMVTSWKGENDPSTGIFSGGLSAQMPTQMFIWKNGATPQWRSGPWDRAKFVGVPEMNNQYRNGYTVEENVKQGTRYFSYTVYDRFPTYVDMSSDGIIRIMVAPNGGNWSVNYAGPTSTCDSYGACGPFGYCRASVDLPVCNCLKGFKPKSVKEWSKRNWTGGCERQTKLSCERHTNTSVTSMGKKDEFWKMEQAKLPDSHVYMTPISNDENEDCKTQCLSNCSCLAYTYIVDIGCLVWSNELIDIQEFTSAGAHLFIRQAHTDSGDGERTKLIITLTAISFISILVSIVFGLLRFSARNKGNIKVKTKRFESIDTTKTSRDTLLECIREHDRAEKFMYAFDTILIATNNFSCTNKLGEGGFGPVYKGKLQEGKEIAVKRPSRSSRQGVEEFKNEMLLISKFQHKNLVKIMGCCVTEDEKLLIYEFMENKSLDTLLFDLSRRAELDWARRFVIIQGVARGLLYLHHDSCLKVIHRDLKVSNILLDEKMNPKISDFGLARIVQGPQILENTQKVVGTRQWLHVSGICNGGIYSEKSDVYSFGVLVLEIISGRKNSSFYYNDQLPSLLGYAWHLWSQGKGLELVDDVLADLYSSSDVMRCLQIALLCVQDNAVDRPTMPEVVLLQGSNTDSPQPKQPTFTFHKAVSLPQPQYVKCPCSGNEATMTIVEGR